MRAMLPRFRSLLAHMRAPSKGIARRTAGGGPQYRRARLERCEERVVLSASGTDLVTALFNDILSRAPNQSGLDSFNNLLHHGTSPAAVAASIWDSPEHRGIQVDNFYQTFLHRAGDPDGRQAWIDSMVAGLTEEAVILDFVTSDEYIQRNSLGQPYVDALYHDILGRDSDINGLISWTNQLAIPPLIDPLGGHNLSDTAVAAAFINSHEHHLQLVDSYYANFLQRPADSAGEADFVQALDQGQANDESVAIAFLSSGEYIAHHPRTPLS